ncbi:MAG: hypothetical protein N2512_01735 [Armatimonadetes bacterium]|nr:hypothetical protein [Armatimonadota bacterium]
MGDEGLPAEGIGEELRADLRLIAWVADRLGVRAYLVGGPVRDALLGRRVADVDVVVEGDAHALALALAEEVGGKAVLHRDFLTAVVRLPGGRHWDLATARRESYPVPGALPVVEPACIEDDLGRRDFTINAMAWRLRPEGPAELLDPFGGRRDIKQRLLRALHDRSFLDDPTRIVRAAVYVARLGFALETATRKHLAAAVTSGALATVSGNRLGEQLRRGLETDAAPGVLSNLQTWGVLSELGLPDCLKNQAVLEVLPLGRRRLGMWPASVGPAAFAIAAGERAEEAAGHLGLPRRYAETARRLKRILAGGVLAAKGGMLRPSEWEQALGGAGPAVVLAVWALADEAQRGVLSAWWRRRKQVVLSIGGRDLLGAGVPEGPAVGVGLRTAWLEALDGSAATREEQLTLALAAARRWLATEESGRAPWQP